MKVLKEPRRMPWPRKYSCLQCEAQLEVGPEDVLYNAAGVDGPMSSAESWSWQCPFCKRVHPFEVAKEDAWQMPRPGRCRET